MYYVYMVDLKDSRKMDEDERRRVQARLKEVKDAVNAYAAGRTRAEFSSGDSLQGYTDDPALALLCCQLILFLMLPIRVHCGVGCGEIYVMDAQEGSNANDGPAYHDALEMLETAKALDRDLMIRLGTGADRLINALLLSTQALRRRNTEKQNMHLALYFLMNFSAYDNEIMSCGFAGYGLTYDREDRNELRADSPRMADVLSEKLGKTKQNVYDMLIKGDAGTAIKCYYDCFRYIEDVKKKV